MLTGERELLKAGFTNIKALGTRAVLSRDWVGNAALRGPVSRGKWFECDTPVATLSVKTTERVIVLRQSRNIWHAFYAYRATASGPTPLCALTMGLGDAIGTDGELRSYSRLVSRAPETWAREFEGLNAAKEQAYNDRSAHA